MNFGKQLSNTNRHSGNKTKDHKDEWDYIFGNQDACLPIRYSCRIHIWTLFQAFWTVKVGKLRIVIAACTLVYSIVTIFAWWLASYACFLISARNHLRGTIVIAAALEQVKDLFGIPFARGTFVLAVTRCAIERACFAFAGFDVCIFTNLTRCVTFARLSMQKHTLVSTHGAKISFYSTISTFWIAGLADVVLSCKEARWTSS